MSARWFALLESDIEDELLSCNGCLWEGGDEGCKPNHTAGQASSGTQAIKECLFRSVREYASKFCKSDPIWQVRFNSFEIYAVAKIEEKLNSMHLNRVRAGLVERPTEWRWGSARW